MLSSILFADEIKSEGYPVSRLNDGQYLHRREERLIARVIDGEAIIVDFKTGDHYSLNSVGTLVWEMADGKHSIKDIVAAILQRYDISEAQARADLSELVSDMENENLVVLGEAPLSS